MKDKSNLVLATLCHTLVDYICIMTVFNLLETSTPIEMRILYNILAFGTQVVIGYIIDISRNKWIGIIGAFLVSIGSLININTLLTITIIGIGNAMFHVGSSLLVIGDSKGRLSDLGIFVSSGAIGVGLGRISYNKLASLLLVILSVIWGFRIQEDEVREEAKEVDFNIISDNHGIVMVALICIIIRALGGGKPLSRMSGSVWIMIIAISSCIGKALGGVLSDKYGARKIGILSMIVSIISFGFSFVFECVGIVIGTITFNMVMPITLGVVIDKLKNYKCFGFGLTTLGLLIGSLLTLLEYKMDIIKSIIEMISLSAITLVFMLYILRGGKSNNETEKYNYE